MTELVFLIQGSESEPYRIVFIADGPTLVALCTCPAGKKGTSCKHRLGLLAGSKAGLVSGNEADVAIVGEWFAKSNLVALMDDIKAAELSFEQAKSRVSECKKRLADAMSGRA